MVWRSPDHRALVVRADGFCLHRKHHRLDDALQPAPQRLGHEQQSEDAAKKWGHADQEDRHHGAAQHRAT
jgi:hypothetical protein